jgi:hypothetical protein
VVNRVTKNRSDTPISDISMEKPLETCVFSMTRVTLPVAFLDVLGLSPCLSLLPRWRPLLTCVTPNHGFVDKHGASRITLTVTFLDMVGVSSCLLPLCCQRPLPNSVALSPAFLDFICSS